MRIRSKLLLAALTAALISTLDAGAASASRSLSVIRGGRAILAIADGERKLTFEGDNGVQIINSVTLHGSLHGLFSKVSGALLGVINRVTVGSRELCRSSIGIACDMRVLPGNRHERLLSFRGTLPRILSVVIEDLRAEFLIQLLETPQCLYRGNIGYELPVAADGRITSMESTRTAISLQTVLREELFRRCPSSGHINGTFSISPPPSITLH
jgi:hypothetical protein